MDSIVPQGSLFPAWTGFENDTTMEAFLKLMSATNVKDFKVKLPQNNSFNLIFVIADNRVNSVFIGVHRVGGRKMKLRVKSFQLETEINGI